MLNISIPSLSKKSNTEFRFVPLLACTEKVASSIFFISKSCENSFLFVFSFKSKTKVSISISLKKNSYLNFLQSFHDQL